MSARSVRMKVRTCIIYSRNCDNPVSITSRFLGNRIWPRMASFIANTRFLTPIFAGRLEGRLTLLTGILISEQVHKKF